MAVRKRTWTTSAGELKTAWVVDYIDQAGKRHIRTYAKKKEADAGHAETRVEVRRGLHTPESQSITVARAAELWMATCEKNRLERATLEPYRVHVDRHIVPFVGSLKLTQLSAPLIREFEDNLLKGDPSVAGAQGKPRSAAMVKKIIGSLGSILSDAQERGLVSHNVVRDLRSKRRPGKDRRADKRHKGRLKIGEDIPSRSEVKAIVNALAGRWRPILLTAIFTGLRSSELRGLRWTDVDLAKSEIHVRQRADEWGVIGAPKTETSERSVPIPPMVLNALREWKLACPKGALGLVFPNGAGNVESHANIVNRGLQPAQVAAGVAVAVLDDKGRPARDAKGAPILSAKYTGLHALRHWFASWCINRVTDGGLALPPKVVQERLGHSTIVMTMDRYGHLFPRGDDTAEMAAAEHALMA